jgi:hypothetical protein
VGGFSLGGGGGRAVTNMGYLCFGTGPEVANFFDRRNAYGNTRPHQRKEETTACARTLGAKVFCSPYFGILGVFSRILGLALTGVVLWPDLFFFYCGFTEQIRDRVNYIQLGPVCFKPSIHRRNGSRFRIPRGVSLVYTECEAPIRLAGVEWQLDH